MSNSIQALNRVVGVLDCWDIFSSGLWEKFHEEFALKHQRFVAVTMGVLKHSKFRDLIRSGLLSITRCLEGKTVICFK